MKKSYLLSLCIIPLLLSGCGGNNEDPEPNPGEMGDPVLTQEQRDKIFTNYKKDEKNSVSRIERLSISEHETTLAQSGEAEGLKSIRVTYDSREGHKSYHIYSFLGGKEKVINHYDVGDTVNCSFTEVYGFYILDFYLAYGETYEHYLIDSFGNELVNKPGVKSADWSIQSISTRSQSVYDSSALDYRRVNYLDIVFFDTITQEFGHVYCKYNSDFRSFTTVESIVDDSSLSNVTPKYEFTSEEKKYSVMTMDSGNSILFQVSSSSESHNWSAPKGGTVVASSLANHHYIYQTNEIVNENTDNYTYVSDEKHSVRTFVLDLVSGKTTEYTIPYLFIEFGTSWLNDVDLTKPISIPTYVDVKMNRISKYQLDKQELRYVIDSNLVLHDDLTGYFELTKFGEKHYIYDEHIIFDSSRIAVSTLATTKYRVHRHKANCLILEDLSSHFYGVANEEGRLIVPCEYPLAGLKEDGTNFIFENVTERIYFSAETMTISKIAKLEDHTYHLFNNNWLVVERDNTGATGVQDKVYYAGKMVDSYSHLSSVPSISKYEVVNLPVNTWKDTYIIIDCAAVVDEENVTLYDVYVSSVH